MRLREAWVIAIPASIGLIQVLGRLLLYFFEHHFDPHLAKLWTQQAGSTYGVWLLLVLSLVGVGALMQAQRLSLAYRQRPA